MNIFASAIEINKLLKLPKKNWLWHFRTEIRDFGVLLPLLISEHPLARWGCVASLPSSPATRNTYIDNTYRPRLLRLKSDLDRVSTKHGRKDKTRGIHTSSPTLTSFRGKQLSPEQMRPRLMRSLHKSPAQHRSLTPPLLQACLLTRVLTLLKRKQSGDQAWKSPKQTKLFKPRPSAKTSLCRELKPKISCKCLW